MKRNAHLLENDAMTIELLSNVRGVLYLRGNREAEGCEGANLPHQSDKTIPVVDVQLAISVVQLHQATVCFEAIQTLVYSQPSVFSVPHKRSFTIVNIHKSVRI